MIEAGQVSINGIVARRPAQSVIASDVVMATPDPYVSRAAHKLAGALDDLQVDVRGRALDAGASTGGFTQVLLQRGCVEVIAVDVGSGQLADSVRSDRRVTVWENTNLRNLTLEHVDARPVDLVVADVSFISLTLLIGPLTGVLRSDGTLLLMIKPQFEVGRALLGRGGIVREAELRRSAVTSVLAAAETSSWFAQGIVPSRLPGSSGNREYFALLRRGGRPDPVDLSRVH
jgi:23S rRNA (cytidine1920-2'-O)/16S rRNA (cytidine1409-2'-O)-methyltransferase